MLDQGTLSLTKLDIVNFDASKRITLMDKYSVLQLNHGLFDNFMHGSIEIADALSLKSDLPIIGEENLEVEFTTQKNGDKVVFAKTYRVYSFVDGIPLVNSVGNGYRLYFVSKEQITNETKQIKKIYSNKSIKDIVLDLTKSLDISSPVIIDETSGIQKIVISSKKPVQAINMLTTYAVSGSTEGSLYTFYETPSGFFFRNIENLYEADSRQTFLSSIQGLGSDTRNEYIQIQDFKIIKGFDYLKSVSDGMYANTVYSIDLLTRTYKKKDYNYKRDFTKTKHIEKGYPFMSIGSTPPNSQIEKLLTTKSSRINSSYIKNNDSSQTFKKGIEEVLPLRISMLRQLENQVVQATVYGNSSIEAGNIITLDIPPNTYNGSAEKKLSDTDYSGRWLVLQVVHTFVSDEHYCIFTCTKDVMKQVPVSKI